MQSNVSGQPPAPYRRTRISRAKRSLRSLRVKILLYGGLPIVALLVFVIASLSRSEYRDLYNAGLFRMASETSSAAKRIDTWNLETVTVPRVMATAQEHGLFGNRDASLAYSRRLLETYPQFTGVYFGYEPNADGQDAAFLSRANAQQRLAIDPRGRFIPYWFRDKQDPSKIVLAPLVDMETSFYYQGVKNRETGVPETQGVALAKEISRHYDPSRVALEAARAKTMVTEPYVYEGKLIVEQTYPIVVNGRFVGVAGVDRALDEITTFIAGLAPFETSEYLLISRRGRIISATMDPALETRPLEATPFAAVLLPFYQSQTDSPAQVVVDEATGEEFLYSAAKVPTGDWTLVMRVARSEIVAPVWAALRPVLWGSGVGLALSLGILGWLAHTVAGRVGMAAQVATRVAQGDLTAEVKASGSDETRTLLRAVTDMTRNLNGLIGQVKSSSIQVISTATQISAAAKSQEATVNEFGSSTTQIAAAVNEISATSRELVTTMHDVSGMVNETAQLADSGRTSLEGMQATMDALTEATSSISTKLSDISDKAMTITGVVTTITKVADQTNLLSLNAAIEAASAGEYGHGFSVVAQEIRRLADQTAVATLDIDHMVAEMQASVSGGVLEMERFTEQVRRGVDAVQRVSDQLGQIIGQVEQLTPRFEVVSQGMQAQSAGAGQISSAMASLTEVARATSSTIADSNRAATGLHEAVRILREEVARFKVAEAPAAPPRAEPRNVVGV